MRGSITRKFDNALLSIKEGHHHVEGTQESDHADQHEDNPVPHIIGVSLVLGFIFMLIVDQVTNSSQSHHFIVSILR